MEDKKDDKEFSELIEYLGGKFTAIDERFSSIDERFSSIEEKLITIDEKLDLKADKSDVSDLLSAVDAYAQKADTYFQEMVMLSHKVDRHEKWFHLLADKLGVKLDY